jgi:hypothetical protein
MAKKASARTHAVKASKKSRAKSIESVFAKSPTRAKDESIPRAYSVDLTRRVLYVDWDTIQVDNNDPNIIYGYWSLLPSEACRKQIYNYANRMDLTSYSYYGPCSGSQEGIYKFTLAE